jgi:hypothetical protein
MKTDTECFEEAKKQWYAEHIGLVIATLSYRALPWKAQSEIIQLAQKIKDGQNEKA